MNISTSELLSYSTILENLISGNLGLQAEISRAVTEGYCKKEEVEKIYGQSQKVSEEFDLKYKEIQKELDMRLKRDLRLSNGIKKSQSLLNEFDAFVAKKNKEHSEKDEQLIEAAKNISVETAANLKIAKDDSIQ